MLIRADAELGANTGSRGGALELAETWRLMGLSE